MFRIALNETMNDIKHMFSNSSSLVLVAYIAFLTFTEPVTMAVLTMFSSLYICYIFRPKIDDGLNMLPLEYSDMKKYRFAKNIMIFLVMLLYGIMVCTSKIVVYNVFGSNEVIKRIERLFTANPDAFNISIRNAIIMVIVVIIPCALCSLASMMGCRYSAVSTRAKACAGYKVSAFKYTVIRILANGAAIVTLIFSVYMFRSFTEGAEVIRFWLAPICYLANILYCVVEGKCMEVMYYEDCYIKPVL